ncbi:MAG: LysR substrate-binding domain-containing protein [Pseudomonadota bacterium]
MSFVNVLHLNSELLRTFSAVAESGNVTQAAENIGRTQSAVSLQVQKLEDVLGVRLFDRVARGVELTEDGKKLVPAAEKVLESLESVGAIFSTPLSGKIRVGIPDDYNETLLEFALGEFASKHTGVEVFVQSGCTAGFPKAIANKELDLAVYSAEPMGSKQAFFSEPTVWVASSQISLNKNLPVPLALFDRHCWWRDVATRALDEAGRPWQTAYMSANYSSVKSAIAAGLGVGILARSAVGENMKILTRRNGFPALPRSSLKLLKRDNDSSRAIDAMEAAILAAVKSGRIASTSRSGSRPG